MNPAIIAGGLKLLGGLFGSKKKTMSPAQSIVSTAQGARQGAKQYGFNPLTLLQASNAIAGAGMDMGGTPPLASLDPRRYRGRHLRGGGGNAARAQQIAE